MLHKRCDIRDYLDEQIRYWGKQRDEANANGDYPTFAMAIHFIDAYQDVRLKIFEEVLEPAVV